MIYLPNELGKISKKVINSNYLNLCLYEKSRNDDFYEVCFDDYALVFINEGQKIIHTKQQDFTINKNEILFFTKGSYLIKDCIRNNYYNSIIICFKESILIELIYKYKSLLTSNFATDEHIFKLNSNELLNSIFTSFLPCFSYKTNEEIIKLKFEELFLALLYSKNNQSFITFLKTIITNFKLPLFQIFSYCEKDFQNVLEMAKFSNMSITSFSKSFKQSFGISAKEWLDNKKFEKAKFLLEFSNKNITEICLEVGFNSPAWFISRYKKRYKTTPKQFQKAKNLYFLH